MALRLFFGLFMGISSLAMAQNVVPGTVYRQGTEAITLDQALADVQPGQVVVLGEEHGTLIQAGQQLQVLETLRKNCHFVSLGMEFFEYPGQALVDSYRHGELDEASFLQQINWGMGFSFDAYRSQVQFPNLANEYVIALNAPRSLTGRISKVGMEGLTADEKALLPPNWTLGNDAYLARFKEVMGGAGHLPSADALEHYFAAQSTWDDTMAWKAAEFLKAHPEQVLVIIVGEFHVQYGGGLPDRLKARGVTATTFSLVNLDGLSEDERTAAVRPSEIYGSRADFVWTSEFSQ
jgi:uncharacterized iron-regulated protein